MKHIKLECNTSGFSYGEVVEVGENGISLEVAEQLVQDGHAKNYVNPIAGKDELKMLRGEVERLKNLLNISIGLPKGQIPDGYVVEESK